MNDEEKSPPSSRFGKEAKIGVAVILLLSLAFAAAVVVRLGGIGSGGGIAAAKQNAEQPEKQHSPDEGEKTFKAAKPTRPDDDSPTVVLATADADGPPKVLEQDFNDWKQATDLGAAKPIEGAGPELTSPPPRPPKPLPGGRYELAAAERPIAERNPRPDPPRENVPGDRAESSGYSPAGAPPPLPPLGKRNAYEDRRDQSPPAQSHADRSRTAPGDRFVQSAPVSKYGDSDRTYTVAEGETLFDIARYELGKASRWVEIYELNREVLGNDIDYIQPGTRLMLPGGDRPDALAEPPGGGFRR